MPSTKNDPGEKRVNKNNDTCAPLKNTGSDEVHMKRGQGKRERFRMRVRALVFAGRKSFVFEEQSIG